VKNWIVHQLTGGPIPSEHQPNDLIVYKLFEANGPSFGRCFGSKSGYRQAHPKHLVVFNANVVRETRAGLLRRKRYEKIWYGDLDITRDEQTLQKLATELKCKLYVLREHDARFDTEKNPNMKAALYWTDGRKHGAQSGSYFRQVVRDTSGKLVDE
jgi:hypothetical protein